MSPSSMREQLEQVRRTRFGQVPRVRLVGRALLRTAESTATPAASIATEILVWAANKWPGLIPKQAFEGQSFDHVQAGLNLAVSALPDRGLWACRFEHLDSETARTWVTEAVVGDLEKFTVFGVLNIASSSRPESPPCTMPRFLRTLLDKHSFWDGGALVLSAPTQVTAAKDVTQLVELLRSPERRLPVVAVSMKKDGTYSVSANALARELAGIAHVASVTTDGSKALSDALGNEWSLYNGSLRTYYPGFTEDSEWARHPLALSSRIDRFEDDQGHGPDAFLRWLKERLFEVSVSPSNSLTQFPDFLSVRSAALADPARSHDAAARMAALEEQIRLLEGKRDEWQALAVAYAEAEGTAKQRLAQEQAHKAVLHDALEKLRAKGAMPSIQYPSQLSEIAAWAQTVLAGRLTLHPRALRTLKKGTYGDPGTVAKALELLAYEYRSMRIADPNESESARKAFHNKLTQLQFNLARSISKTEVGDFESEYYVEYVIGQKPRQLLEWHLSKGTGRDERTCLRIYFFYDEDEELVVVGSLPGHLTNRFT